MLHPIQKLCYSASKNLIFAGIGGRIKVVDGANGAVIGEWDVISTASNGSGEGGSCATTTNTTAAGNNNHSTDTNSVAGQKRKVGDGEAGNGSVEGEVKKLKVDDEKPSTEEGQGNEKAKSKKEKRPPGWRIPVDVGSNCITHVMCTRDGRWIAAATNEDKTLRVFRVDVEEGNGEGVGRKVKLVLQSERQMPKRLCALRVVEDESVDAEGKGKDEEVTLICADKFGDVYSVPLINIPLPTPTPSASKAGTESAAGTPTPTPGPGLEPTRKIAGGGIITTERNKKAALKAQNAMRDSLAKLESKELPFAHKLVLGHVSLLIDVLPAAVTVEGREKKRRYVISADKDEHIRVSRYPDGHVIEGFCLGHTMYVSKLCVPEWDERCLISGGGDSWLGRWNWVEGKVVEKVDIGGRVKEAVERVESIRKQAEAEEQKGEEMDVDVQVEEKEEKKEEKKDEKEDFAICVTGILSFVGRGDRKQIVVTVEGLPALFIYEDRAEKGFHYTHTIGVSGSVLDMAVIGPQIWVTVDPQSTGYDVSSTSSRVVEILEAVEGSADQLENVTDREMGKSVNEALSVEAGKEKLDALKEVFYGSKQLRKFENENHTFGPEFEAQQQE